MKQDQQKVVYYSPGSTRHFLFCKMDSNSSDEVSGEGKKNDPFLYLNFLQKEFPDILAGEQFIKQAMAQMKSCAKFGALLLRIDDFEPIRGTSVNDRINDILVDVSKALETICKQENGIWGQLDQDLFGCFFAEKSATLCFEIAGQIKKKLAESRSETLSIGTAAYPMVNFNKEDILENARKALDHAEFFGHDSRVAFDTVSLNISGDKLYQKGDIEGAIEEFKTALLIDPSNVNVYNSIGVCYGVMGELKKALEEFETAIRLDPDEVMAVYNAGFINMLMGNKDKALEYFMEADSLGKDVFEVAFQAGRLYLEMGKPEAGQKFLEKAVGISSESGPAWRYLGECYAALDMTDKAISAYKKAIKIVPDDAASLSALGYLFEVSGENSEIALIFCKHSVAVSPENGLFRHRLGRIFLKQSRQEEALKEFEKANDLGHDSAFFIEMIQSQLTARAS
jgi:tetratricopeptide (TPR) repeat protein